MVDELASSGEVLCMEFRGDAMRQGEMLAHWQDAVAQRLGFPRGW